MYPTEMTVPTVRKIGVVLLALALVGGGIAIGTVSSQMAAEEHDVTEEDPQQTTYLRVIHASPDAPAVDVLVENETVLSNVEFGDVSDYLSLQAGTYNVTITAAGDREAVVFDDAVTLEPRTPTTIAASGEITEDAPTTFEPVIFNDNAVTPDNNSSAISVMHLSPDAPTVDVTAGDGSVVLADNVSYQNASDYVTVPAGNYTVEIRAATATNDGPVVTTVDVSLAGGTAYSALAVGYLSPDEAAADTPFQVLATPDATMTIHVPSEKMTDVEMDNETEMGNETEMAGAE